MYTYNPTISEVEAKWLEIEGVPQLHKEFYAKWVYVKLSHKRAREHFECRATFPVNEAEVCRCTSVSMLVLLPCGLWAPALDLADTPPPPKMKKRTQVE